MKQDDWDVRSNDSEEFTSSIHQRTEELYRIPDGEPDEDGFLELPALVLRDIVVFPRMISPIFVTPGSNLLAIQDAQYNFQTMVSLVQRDPDMDEPTPEDLMPIGVELAVGRLLNMPEGNSSALVQGRRRMEIVEYTQVEPFFRVRVKVVEE